ncbi:MAG: hypothetical protein GY737_31345, partial [Desulfobacteraceae bacterium]|nr:hypothetical protein [Desulfobacteraceae bacterium]
AAKFVFKELGITKAATIDDGDPYTRGLAELFRKAFIKSVGTDGVGMYFADHAFIESAANDELVTEYTSRFGNPPKTLKCGFAYDAANLLFNAIEAVAVREKDGTLHIGRQALRDALYATVDFEGVTGKLSCDEFGDCGVARFKIVRLDDPASGLSGMEANVIQTYTFE